MVFCFVYFFCADCRFLSDDYLFEMNLSMKNNAIFCPLCGTMILSSRNAQRKLNRTDHLKFRLTCGNVRCKYQSFHSIEWQQVRCRERRPIHTLTQSFISFLSFFSLLFLCGCCFVCVFSASYIVCWSSIEVSIMYSFH